MLGGSFSTENRQLAIINKSKTRAILSNSFISMLLSTSASAYYFSDSGTDISSNVDIGLFNSSDTGLTLPDTIYTEKESVLWVSTSNNNVKLFPIYDTTTSLKQITGIKITASIQNTSTSAKTVNMIKLEDIYDNSDRFIFAIKVLDEPVTIQPQETYVVDYVLDNLYPVIPDTV